MGKRHGEGWKPPRRSLRREGNSATYTRRHSPRRRLFAECFFSGYSAKSSPSAFSPHSAKKRKSDPPIVRCASDVCQTFAECANATLGDDGANSNQPRVHKAGARQRSSPSGCFAECLLGLSPGCFVAECQASPSASRAVRRAISSPSAGLRRAAASPGVFVAECQPSRQTSCQMVPWSNSSPSAALGKVYLLGEASSQVTIWHLEHLFAECQTRRRRLCLVPHSEKSPQFSTIFLFFKNPCISKHNICIYFQI